MESLNLKAREAVCGPLFVEVPSNPRELSKYDQNLLTI